MSFLALLITILCTVHPLKIIHDGKIYSPIRAYSIKNSVWIRLRDCASVLKFDVEYDASVSKMTLHDLSHTISVYGDNPFVKVDERLINLPQEIRLSDGEILVSAPQLQCLFGEILGIDFMLEKGGKELRFLTSRVEVEGIKLEERKDTTELLVYTSAPLQFSSETGTPGVIVLTLLRSWIRSNFPFPRPKGRIKTIGIVPLDDRLVIELSTTGKTRILLAGELRNPPGLSLTLVGPGSPLRREDEWYGKIDRIVIDPGHGGKDPGAVGSSGLLEKDVNLQVSKMLKKLFEERLGAEVIMTREDDSFVPLNERARVANESSADLFISIHCNAAPGRKKATGGVETYFLSVAQTDEARAVEARENASVRFEGDEGGGYNFDDVSLILWDLAQNEFLEESERLAGSVQKGLARSVSIRDRGINQAGFFVLNGVYMPSILIECAFISNKKEEALLRNESFQRKLAEGIFKGVTAFKREHDAKSSI